MPNPLVWTAGDESHRDFAPARAWLAAHAAPVPAEHDEGFPRAIVLFESRPGVVSPGDGERLRRRAPLAKLVAIAGSLCEGDRRAARQWQGVTRIYWHEAPARLPAELGLPAAAKHGAHGGLAVICAATRGDYQALADACWAGGWRAAWHPPKKPANLRPGSVLVVDGWQALPAKRSPAPTLLLLPYPRSEDVVRAANLGIAHVLARPWRLADLVAALDSFALGPAMA
jgi:hypothetical protein